MCVCVCAYHESLWSFRLCLCRCSSMSFESSDGSFIQGNDTTGRGIATGSSSSMSGSTALITCPALESSLRMDCVRGRRERVVGRRGPWERELCLIRGGVQVRGAGEFIIAGRRLVAGDTASSSKEESEAVGRGGAV